MNILDMDKFTINTITFDCNLQILLSQIFSREATLELVMSVHT